MAGPATALEEPCSPDFVAHANDLSAPAGNASRTRADRETSCYRGVTYDGLGAPPVPWIGEATPYTWSVCNIFLARCFGTRATLKSA